MNKIFNTTIALSNKLDSLFPNRDTNPISKKSFDISCDIIKYITNKSIIYNGVDTEYHEFGSRLLQLRHSARANRILQILKKNDILIALSSKRSKESYVTKKTIISKTNNKESKGICKKYKLNNLYSIFNIYNNNIKTIKTINTKNNINNYPILSSEPCELSYNAPFKRYSAKKYSKLEYKMFQDYKETVDTLKINYSQLVKQAKEKIDKVNISSFEYNDKDIKKNVEVHFLTSGKKQWMNTESAEKAANRNYETLFQDGKKYYVAGKKQFEEYKKRNMSANYFDAIRRLQEGNLYAKRNETNGRLDTNFTNLPSFLMKEIMKQNNLVQLDLANSQFSILAHMMEKEGYNTKDFNKFKESAYNGTLYDESMKSMGTNRKETKTAFFESLFSKDSMQSSRKDNLKKLYPTVVKYISEVKNKTIYKDFSIGLQRQESTIFIDGLYPLLKDKLNIVFSKHDAFIIKEEESGLAESIIKKFFEEINFKGKMIKE